ncbi:MAG: hypothetical protein RLZ22_51 [Verrucomicrobiota bacterium]|jgi:hypothetical protein
MIAKPIQFQNKIESKAVVIGKIFIHKHQL